MGCLPDSSCTRRPADAGPSRRPFIVNVLRLYKDDEIYLANTARNSTASFLPLESPDTYWGQYEGITKFNSHLNVAERLWAAWYAYMQNDVLATGIMSFALHEGLYFGRALMWMIVGAMPFFHKYKIQNVSRHRRSGFDKSDSSKKSPQQESNGNAPSMCFLPILPSNCLKYGMYDFLGLYFLITGSFIPWHNTLVFRPACPFLRS